jgi:hypothetical protein
VTMGSVATTSGSSPPGSSVASVAQFGEEDRGDALHQVRSVLGVPGQ